MNILVIIHQELFYLKAYKNELEHRIKLMKNHSLKTEHEEKELEETRIRIINLKKLEKSYLEQLTWGKNKI